MQVDYDGEFAWSDVACVVSNKITEVLVYPNPAQDAVHVSIENYETDALVELLSLHGKVIQKQTVSSNGDASFQTDNLETGIYFIKVTQNANVTLTRFFIDQ